MKVERLKISAEKAREYWRLYQGHLAGQTKADREIAAIYKRLAQGRTVIRALESIRAAGATEDGYPRLAIARADETQIECRINPHSGIWKFEPRGYARSSSRVIEVAKPEDAPTPKEWKRLQTNVPLIPVHVRPKRGLQNYHILFEADWREYPIDPYLLRRFGEDAWLVVAAWDLTPVERAVMAQRISA
jgi:hypothetical protein